MVNDLRIAVRRLARTPVQSAAFVLTLGLGIGLNTAIFSMVNGVLLRPLPYTDSERIVYLRQPAPLAGIDDLGFSFVEIADYRSGARTIDEFVEYGDLTFNVVSDAEPHRAVGGLVSSNYFGVLGLGPQLGRVLGPQDDGSNGEPVMVLTHDYWQRAFGGDPGVLDRTVKLWVFSQPKTVRIVGVLRPGTLYTGTRRQDFFVNYASSEHYGGAAMLDERNHRMTDVFARLAPGRTVAAAAAELQSINRTLHSEYPEAYPERLGITISVAPWQDELTAEARPMLLILAGAVALVLVLACANVANLTLTRLVRRERELAIRAALGAGMRRLRSELLVENLVLAVAGATLGLILAVFGMDLLVRYANRFTVRTGEIGIDFVVLAFTGSIAVGIALLLAWAPPLPGLTGGGTSSVAGAARGVVGLPRKRTQQFLVVSQLALCFTLLVGAGLLVRSLLALSRVDPGLQYRDVVSMEAPNVTGMPVEANRHLMDQLLESVRAFPGVREAAFASRAPFSTANFSRQQFRIEGGDNEGVASPQTAFNAISPGYFGTVGVSLVRGRGFEVTDQAATEPVAVINQSLARVLFGDDDALDRRIAQQQFNGEWGPWLRVVGVAADTREYGLSLASTQTLYRPAAQAFPGQSLLIHLQGDAGAVAQHVAGLVRNLDAERPVDNIRSLESLRFEDLAPPRLNATLFSAFALLALTIAAVGVLGVLTFAVSQRTPEFGVRLALGAQRSEVLGIVLREGIVMLAIALAAGSAGSLLLTHFLRGLLFQVGAADATTYATVAVLLSAVAVTAAYLPARQASRVDPAVALRAD